MQYNHHNNKEKGEKNRHNQCNQSIMAMGTNRYCFFLCFKYLL